jgi:hypothetical protein
MMVKMTSRRHLMIMTGERRCGQMRREIVIR